MIVFKNTLKRIFITPLSLVFLLLFPCIFTVLLIASNSASDDEVVDPSLSDLLVFGAVDLDNSVLSKTLIEKLEVRFKVIDVAESDISAQLTEQEVPWVLLIPQGYERDILEGKTPSLEGYSLTISDVSAMGSANAESITRALMLLGTDDEAVLAEWSEKSALDIQIVKNTDNWAGITFWFGFFGWVGILTAYFIAKALVDDKRGGMPDRIGVLPHSPRKHLIQSALAVFGTMEITIIMLMTAVFAVLGTIPNIHLLFLILSLYNLFAVSMVLAVLSITKDLGVASGIIVLSSSLFSMIGGVYWPLELVPEFMQKFAWFSPAYWLMRGIGGIKEITFDGFGISILFLLGFTVVAVLLGGWKSIQKMDDDAQ
ncbi:MAG: ABC transporter permease [Oscillospiraceae bacterium]|nr:ABC transporter permease [Oscillospiraceae bacterium]